MKVKELKFTAKNLERHCNKAVFENQNYHSMRQLCTTRNEIKGRLCTVFRVKGMGYFMLDDIRRYHPNQRWMMYSTLWKQEGFPSPTAFRKEIERLYKPDDTLYVHLLFEVFVGE